MGEIISSDVTYASMITNAASILANILSGSPTYSSGVYSDKSNSYYISAGGDMYSSSGTLSLKYNRKYSYSNPGQNTIATDITNFMKNLGFNINAAVTNSGLLSFFYALNFFVEKAIIRRSYSANPNIAVHLHYSPPNASSYTKLPFNYPEDNIVTSTKVNDIYTQLKNTDLRSVDSRSIELSSSQNSSSSSSSSSCSSSSFFIVYFNLK